MRRPRARLAGVAFTLGALAANPVRAAPPEGLVPPVLQAPVQIAYPDELGTRDEPPSGTVKVRFVVTTEGRVSEVTLVEGLDPRIDARVLEAVAGLRYTPATY